MYYSTTMTTLCSIGPVSSKQTCQRDVQDPGSAPTLLAQKFYFLTSMIRLSQQHLDVQAKHIPHFMCLIPAHLPSHGRANVQLFATWTETLDMPRLKLVNEKPRSHDLLNLRVLDLLKECYIGPLIYKSMSALYIVYYDKPAGVKTPINPKQLLLISLLKNLQ